MAVHSHAYWRDTVSPSQGRPTPLLSLKILVEFSLGDGSVLRSAATSGMVLASSPLRGEASQIPVSSENLLPAQSTVNLGSNQVAKERLPHPVFKESYSPACEQLFIVWLGMATANWEPGPGRPLLCFWCPLLLPGNKACGFTEALMPLGGGVGCAHPSGQEHGL